MDEQKEHELAASEKYKLWLERALKKEALREKDRNRKQCERERDIGVAPTISAPTISVRIKNVVGVTLDGNSWRVQTDGIQKILKKKEDAERLAYEHFESNPDMQLTAVEAVTCANTGTISRVTAAWSRRLILDRARVSECVLD